VDEAITSMVKGHTRRVRPGEVRYTGAQCGREGTIQQHLGRPPRYCPPCREQLERWRREDDRDDAAARMRRLRESRRAAQLAPPSDRPRQTSGH
jgi:hypothetical protein